MNRGANENPGSARALLQSVDAGCLRPLASVEVGAVVAAAVPPAVVLPGADTPHVP